MFGIKIFYKILFMLVLFLYIKIKYGVIYFKFLFYDYNIILIIEEKLDIICFLVMSSGYLME